jgi:hypothetical protein
MRRKKSDGPGRKIQRGEKATGRIVLSMLPDEADTIRELARAAGKEVSPWAREILLAQAPNDDKDTDA